MIVNVDEEYLKSIGEARSSQLYCDIETYGHYIECFSNVKETMLNHVRKHASTFQRELISTGRSMNLTGKLRRYLTSLNASDFTFDDLLKVLTKPSQILVENSVNEGSVYDNMIQTYSRDTLFASLFQKLKVARNNGRLQYRHAGGCGNIEGLLRQADDDEYDGIAKHKFCVVIDRDADGPEYMLIQRKDNMLKFLSGKDSAHLEDADVYSLDQPLYNWHMWYKREIENYFPEEHFARVGADLSTEPTVPADRNYKKLSGIRGYSKENLKDLTFGMSREKYETGLKSFYVNQQKVSELQLFLLKLVKLI